MTTCHGGAGHTGEDRELESHIEDVRGIDIDPDNNNANTVWMLQLLLEDQRQMAAMVTSYLMVRQT